MNKDNEDNNRRSSDGNIDWTTEMKVNLPDIEKRERRRRRGFLNRMKDAWDVIYDIPMSTQCLRDNATIFRKHKSILNLIEVREIENIEPQLRNVILNRNENIQDQIQDQTESVEGNEALEANIENENCEEMEEMRIKFIENLNKVTPTTDKPIEHSERLAKLKVDIKTTDIKNANRILQQHLSDTNDICKVVDTVYAIGRTIEERLGVKQNRKKLRKTGKMMKREEYEKRNSN